MCGIIGSISIKAPLERTLFNRQRDTLTHRGPDDCGSWFREDNRVALGSRRLAIQDLSAAGRMPMGEASGQVWIMFNGEIYNFQRLRAELEMRGYSFHTGTDTEVILAAYLEWDTDCLQHLNGMFALAIYDGRREISRDGRLFLARDRAGEKPLYYWKHADGLVFASELKALMVEPAFPR